MRDLRICVRFPVECLDEPNYLSLRWRSLWFVGFSFLFFFLRDGVDNCSLFCTHVLGSCVIIHFFFHQLIFPKCHITYSLSGSLPQVILYSMDASPSLGAPCSVDPMLISVMCCVGCAWSLSCAQLFVTPWTIARQALQSMGILQVKNTGVGCHALLQGIFQPRD